MKKKPLMWLLAVAAVFVPGVILMVIVIAPRLSSIGTAGLDNWVAQQVTKIANSYLVPEIQFDSFSYKYPGVLELKGVRFVAPDAGKTRVVEAALLRVTLAEVPSIGQPIVIERIDLDRPALRLLRTPGGTGGFKGLLPFVKGDAISNQSAAPSDVRLSSVFKIKKLTLSDGRLEYNDGSGPETMTLAGLTLNLDVSPDNSAGGAGWYGLDFNLDRSPIFAVAARGRVNIDTLQAEAAPVTLSVNLDDGGAAALPPELQRTLREHDARGTLKATLTGNASVRSPLDSALSIKLALENFNVAAGEYRLPVDRAEADLALASGRLTASRATASLLTGAVDLRDLSATLTEGAKPLSMSWSAQGLDLRELLRTKTTPGQPPRLAGKFASSGSASGSLAALPGSLTGSGAITVRDGRLVNIPVLSDLIEAMNLLQKAMGAGTRLEDTADVNFDLTGEGVKITKGEATTQVAAARFTGLIRYNGTLDLIANAGPLEKVQGLFGKVGGIIGEVTDKLVKYRISGPASDPKVEVKPLGL